MIISELIAVLLLGVIVLAVFGAEIFIIARFFVYRVKGRSAPRLGGSRIAVIIHILAAIGLCCLLYALLVEPQRLEVTHFEMATPKLRDNSLRIVLFSDMHCDTKVRNEEKLVEIVNSLKPDVIVYTGDSLNTPKALPLFKDTLGRMNASVAKLAVRGNFDTHLWRDIDLFGQTGFEELAADTIKLEKNGEAFYVTGFAVPFPLDFEEVLRQAPPDDFHMLLYHHSDLAESLDGLNVDLYLSGHTHGGQVRMPFYGALITLSKFGKKYEAGRYTIGRTTLYVNRGIGLEKKPAPQVRFLCRPEITVFDIRPQSAAGGQ